MARLKTFNNRRQSKQRIMETAFAANRKRERKIINLGLAYDMTDRRLRQLGYSKRAIRDVRKNTDFLKNYSIGAQRLQQAFARVQISAEEASRNLQRFSQFAPTMQDFSSRLYRGGIVGRKAEVLITDLADVEERVLGTLLTKGECILPKQKP